MRCVICKQGEALPGTATISLSRDDTTIVVKGVPASRLRELWRRVRR